MNRVTRFLVLPLLVALLAVAGLYLSTGGHLDRHFHGSISDRSPQSAIHTVTLNSGFQLRQAIDTQGLDHINRRLRQAPLCIWLRMEYPRKARGWTTNGTIELRLSTPEKVWTTRFTSDQIKTYFQPFCFRDSRAEDVFERPTFLDMTVVEPDLSRVAMIALGPGNGSNNALIDDQVSEYTATYILTADPGPDRADMARFGLALGSFLVLILTVLIPLTGGRPRPDGANP